MKKSEQLEKLCGKNLIPNELIPNDFELTVGDVLEFDVNGLKREHLCIGFYEEEAYLAPVARKATTGELIVTRSQIASYKKRGNDLISDLRTKNGEDYLVRFTGFIAYEEFAMPFEKVKEEE